MSYCYKTKGCPTVGRVEEGRKSAFSKWNKLIIASGYSASHACLRKVKINSMKYTIVVKTNFLRGKSMAQILNNVWFVSLLVLTRFMCGSSYTYVLGMLFLVSTYGLCYFLLECNCSALSIDCREKGLFRIWWHNSIGTQRVVQRLMNCMTALIIHWFSKDPNPFTFSLEDGGTRFFSMAPSPASSASN